MSYDADVIVAGAGPAGSTAAARLALHGLRVVLCDRAVFPRDKTCGDGLITDTIETLKALGLYDEVARQAYCGTHLRIVSPGGIQLLCRTPFLVMPRFEFDAVLYTHALSAGAAFRQVIVEAPIESDGRVGGIIGRTATGSTVELRAPLTVLATGAAAQVLQRFDPTARSAASAMAIRAYARSSRPLPDNHSIIALEKDLLPGYTWAFPTASGSINVGVGVISGKGLKPAVNLRDRLDHLVAGGGLLGGILGPLRTEGEYRGAPLRTGLTGSSFGRPGLAIVGDAAGTTYPISGEGIGKAMESSMLVAELVERGVPLPSVGVEYPAALQARYRDRFVGYQRAEWWMTLPGVADYVARRAVRSIWVRERLEGILSERTNPGRIFSLRALWRLATRNQ
jgi:geranylgeranyl reductase family protein